MKLIDHFKAGGRTTRLTYWRRSLLYSLVFIIVWIVGMFAVIGLGAWGAIAFLPALPPLLAQLVNLVRRLHDRDKSWPWAILFLLGSLIGSVPSAVMQDDLGGLALFAAVIGFGVSVWGFIEIGCLKGTAGPNRFGPEP